MNVFLASIICLLLGVIVGYAFRGFITRKRQAAEAKVNELLHKA